MSVTNIIIVITFISALVERLAKKPVAERKWIFKKINFDYVTFGLLVLLVAFQLWDKIKESSKESKKENQSTETYKNVVTTHEKVNLANKQLENVIKDANAEIQYIKKELVYIENLNNDIKDVRKNIEYNLVEFKNLNGQYEKQLKLEKEKISDAKPNLRITSTKSIIDSTSFAFQFSFSNYGKRIADSVKYFAAMIFVDSVFKIDKLELIKTNYSEYNVLTIPGETGDAFYINSPSILKKEIKNYYMGFLLIKYTFKDDMTGIKHKPDLKILMCISLNKGNSKYGENIELEYSNNLKQYLYMNYRTYYNLLFEK